jgi:hypothetical protein
MNTCTKPKFGGIIFTITGNKRMNKYFITGDWHHQLKKKSSDGGDGRWIGIYYKIIQSAKFSINNKNEAQGRKGKHNSADKHLKYGSNHQPFP